MELKPGYKQTEVGVIPEDWEVDKIKHLSQITTGSRNTQDRIENGAYPFFVRSQKVEKINSFSFDGEAVLTAGDGVGTGKVFHYISGKFDFHQRVYKISNFSPTLDGYYFYLYFSSHFYNRISQMTAKSSVDSVRMEMIADMQIPIPPTKAEQTAIANALSDADALIQSLTRLIAKKRQIKQAAMQTLLNPYENGRLKAGWVVKSLGEICDVRDGTHDSPKYLDSGVKFVTSKNIVNNKLDLSEISYISQMDAYEINKRSKVDHGDILMSMIGTIGNAVLVDYEPDFCIKNIALLKTKNVNAEFLIQYIGSIEFQALLNESLDGGIQKFISLGKLRALQIRIPFDKCEQTRIATILSGMDAEIAVLEAKLAKYRHIKQGMMQNLLTGRIRLVKPESNTGAAA